MYEFWDKWTRANELEKVELVKSLTIIDKNSKMIRSGFEHGMATLLNSYFEDLKEYLETKNKE